MKSPALLLVWAIAISSCSGKDDPNTLGGDPNVEFAKVGSSVTVIGGIKLGDETVNVPASAVIVKNEGGVATLRVTADLSADPRLAKYAAMLPASAKNAEGKIDTEVKFRVTSEGIQDYFNKDGAQHTVVKYGSSVGDTYKLTKSDGVTITRTVVAKSDKDDFPYGFYNIKTITVEQDSRIPGIKKFVYRANHRFGLVWLQVVAEDGSTASFYLSAGS